MQIAVPGLTYDAMLDASPIPTSVVDAEGTVVYVNDAFLMHASKARGVEIRREDRTGRNIREFITGGYGYDRQEWLEIYNRVLKEGEAVFLQEIRFQLSSDREMYVDVRMNPIRGEDEKVIAAVMTWQDVTDRVKARREKRRRIVLDRVRVSVYEMREAADIQNVLVSLYGALKDIGVEFDACSVEIVDEGEKILEDYDLGPERMHLRMNRLPLRNSAVYEAWRNKQPIYRRDLDEEDRYNERAHIKAGSDKSIRSVLDVPFSRGTIAMNSVRPDAFSEEDIELLKGFAEALSEGYTRFEDIRRIEESEEKYRSLVEHLQDVIFRLDPEGNYLLISPVVEQLVGYKPEEFYADRTLGRRIVLPEDFEKAEEGFWKVSAGEISRDVEYRVRTKEGGILWMSQNMFPVRDAERRIVAIEGTIRDITEHKRWHEIERMRYWVRSMQEPEEWTEMLGMLDEILVNCGVEFRACGVNIVNLQERTMRMYTFEDHRLSTTGFQGPTVPVIEAVVRENRTIYRPDTLVPGEFEEGFTPKQGLERRSVVDVPFVGGTVAMSSPKPDAFSERDIETLEMIANVVSEGYVRYKELIERKRVEKELKQYSERLEEMVEERTKELQDAQEQLVRQERLAVLGQLAGGVGHELRNPLGVIKNATYFLNMVLEKPEPEVKEMLEILEEEVANSEKIISSLLNFARTKPPTRRKVDVNHVVQEALSRITVTETVEVVRHLDETLPAILADPDQLGQAFGNIILNAIQSIPEGGQLVIKSEVSSPEWVVVSFADTGVGIPEENLDKLFEPLFTTKARGIGLGLALVKIMVEGHGGTIEVHSEEGRGSTFTVRLPLAVNG